MYANKPGTAARWAEETRKKTSAKKKAVRRGKRR
jgi:hypothetical protein